jgi:hypothetical protein
MPRFPTDPLWQLGPGLEVARLVIDYLAELRELERSEVWG